MHEKDDLAILVLELISCPGGEENGIALFHLQATASTVLQQTTRAGSQDLSSLRLGFGAVRQKDSSCRHFGRFLAPHDNPVSQRPDLRRSLPAFWHGSRKTAVEETTPLAGPEQLPCLEPMN